MRRMLITGATSGIGEALLELALVKGYQVIACGRNADKLAKLAKRPGVTALSFDITDLNACQDALVNIQADIYVLNAGICEYVNVDSLEPAMFKRVFDVNVFGVINCLGAIVPNLVRGNQVLVIDSLARLLPFTRSAAYGASKAASYYLTESLAVDLAGRGIRITSVSPGFVHTPLTAKNDFTMPMAISPQQAASALLTGIEKRAAHIYFPWLFAFILRLLAKLPAGIRRALARMLKDKTA